MMPVQWIRTIVTIGSSGSICTQMLSAMTKSPWMLLFACLPPQWPASRRPHALAADRPHSHAAAARLVQHPRLH